MRHQMDQQSRSHNRTSPNMSVLKFFMWNRALATVWCTFFRPHLPKVLRPRQFFAILKCKPSSRYSPSCALFVDNFCRSRPQPAETDTLLRRPQKPLNPKKNTWFRAQECFHPWFSRVPEMLRFPTTWWLVVDMMMVVYMMRHEHDDNTAPGHSSVTRKFSN